MSNTVTLLIGAVQAIVVVASAALAWVSIRKFRDSRGVDFVLNAESAIDPLRQSLVNAPVAVIRNVYRAYNLDDLSDEDCQAFPFMQSLYSHVSRICYILTSRRLDLGLHESERRDLIESWMKYLSLFRSHPAMAKIHASALVHRDFNEAFLSLALQYLGDPTHALGVTEETLDAAIR